MEPARREVRRASPRAHCSSGRQGCQPAVPPRVAGSSGGVLMCPVRAGRAGTLYLVGTPIGHLEDITYRAVRVLGEADRILAEDTRRARVLLDRYAIARPVSSFHEHNEVRRLEPVMRAIES